MKTSSLAAAALISLIGLSGCTGQSQGSASAPASAAASTSAPASAGADAPSTAASETTVDPTAPPAAAPTAAPPAEATTAPGANPAQPATPAPPVEGKERFTGDHAKATAADSAKINELAKQWHSPEEEALFHEKMDASGLSSNVPPEQAEVWYGQAAAACQRRFDGYAPPLQGAWLEIENLALSIYCPELK